MRHSPKSCVIQYSRIPPSVNSAATSPTHLGGSRDFYHRVAESAHEMGCREAVARFDAGVTVTNLDQLERKTVAAKVFITRKGSDQRISGRDVKLSTD